MTGVQTCALPIYSGVAAPASDCPAPVWERAPSRVTFDPKNEQKFTFTVPTRAVDAVTEEENAEEE